MARPYVLFLAGGVLLASLLSQAVQAACTAETGWSNRILTFNLPAQIIVQADAPVGTVFYDSRLTESHNGEKYATCTAGSYTLGVKYQNGWVTNSDGIAATNVPGVGVRLYWASTSRDILVPTDPYSTLNTAVTTMFFWTTNQVNWRVQLIKTGAISGGTLRTGSWAVFGVGGVLLTTLNIGGGGAITSVGCTVTTPNVNVALGQRRKSEFTGVGSATPWQTFDIGLNCNPSARINVRIDATQDPSNVAGVMQLDRASVPASGVGVQLWYRPNGGTPVNFGQETFYYTSPNGGNETVQLQARYYQTSQTIIAGTANATATFTLTYK